MSATRCFSFPGRDATAADFVAPARASCSPLAVGLEHRVRVPNHRGASRSPPRLRSVRASGEQVCRLADERLRYRSMSAGLHGELR